MSSRALRRPVGQSGPSPRGVGNETDFQKKKDAHVGDIITLCDRYAHSFTSWAGSGVYGLAWVVCR
jgi:hypothetical protein